jgi:hypothetical protein
VSIAVFRGADCGHVDARAEAIFFERSLGAAQVQTVVATPDFQELSMTDSFQSRRPGPGKPLTAKRELYLRLMRQGLSNSEVCRQVGGHSTDGRSELSG